MRPVKKANISILIVVLIFCSMVACANDEPSGPTSPMGSRAEAPIAFNAISLPDDLIFEDEPMLEIAKAIPTFGGFYFGDAGEIVVLSTSMADLSAAETRIRPHLGVHRAAAARFVARAADYSFLELARYRTALRQRIFDIPGVVSLGVRESANRVKVGIEEGVVEARVRELIRQLEIPQAAVLFVSESHGEDVSLAHRRSFADANSVLTLTLQDQQPNGRIQGGWEIRTSLGETCTLGFAALRASDHLPVFVTNSHCTTVRTALDGSTFTQPTGQQVGHEILDPPSYTCGFISDDCRQSDAALIEADVAIDLGRIARTTVASSVGCEECMAPLDIDPAQPVFVIDGRNDHVFENETLNKVGRTTGWTRGNVEDTCDDFESGEEGSGDTWVKQCSDRVDFSIGHGDSGSPVFSIAPNGTVVLRGVVFTRQTCCFGYEDAWMSDLNQIENDLGPLIVYDPGPPGVDIAGPAEVPPNVWCEWSALVTDGVPPFSFQWSQMFSGSGPTVQGFVGSSGGDLFVEVTDSFGRHAQDAVSIVVEGEPGPFICE